MKLTVKQILCINLVKYGDKYTEMHGEQNVKIGVVYFNLYPSPPIIPFC